MKQNHSDKVNKLLCDQHLFPSAKEDAGNVSYYEESPQTRSPSYRLAYDDLDFIMRDESRPIRL